MPYPLYVLGKISCALVLTLGGLNAPAHQTNAKPTPDQGNRVAYKVGDTRRFRVQLWTRSMDETPVSALILSQKVLKVNKDGSADVLETIEERRVSGELQNEEVVPEALHLDSAGRVRNDTTYDKEAWRFLEMIVPNISSFTKATNWTIKQSFKGRGTYSCKAHLVETVGDNVKIAISGDLFGKETHGDIKGELVWNKAVGDYQSGTCMISYPAQDRKDDFITIYRFDRL